MLLSELLTRVWTAVSIVTLEIVTAAMASYMVTATAFFWKVYQNPRTWH